MRLRRVAQGAIAQLVERLHGMQEVRSSILLSSTRHSAELSKIDDQDPVPSGGGIFRCAGPARRRPADRVPGAAPSGIGLAVFRILAVMPVNAGCPVLNPLESLGVLDSYTSAEAFSVCAWALAGTAVAGAVSGLVLRRR
jgi:hypothetical protein